MTDIKFSIAIPAYKRQFLKECIDSILSQTYANLELIILNDDSPQKLESVVNLYDDERIKYYKNEKNEGAYNIVNNWNKCLEYSEGDYFICIGDDDKLMPNCLEIYKNLIEKYPDLDIYHSWTEIINEESVPFDILNKRPEYESVYSMIRRAWKGERQFIGDWLFKISTLKDKGGFYFLPYAWSSDFITVFSLAKEKGVANSQIPIFQYREHGNTITKNSNIATFKVKALRQTQKWYEDFLKEEPTFEYDIICHSLLVKELKSYVNKRIAYDISENLSSNPINLFYWLFNMKKYGITLKTMILSYGFLLKNKL